LSLLIISEKEIAARRIASILSRGAAKRTNIARVPVHRYTDDSGRDVAVVGLRGHVFNLDYPSKLNNWFSISPRNLIDVEPVKVEEAPHIVEALRQLSRKADEVVIATDYDREGELIGVEALAVVLEQNPDLKVRRSRFSALTPQEVNGAFENPVEVDHALAAAGETRQVIDLVWGAVLTRFISMASSRVGSDFLSVGRVQSPTLALIVDLEQEIEAFVPTPYWELWAHCLKDDTEFRAHHKTKRFDERAAAEAAHAHAGTATEGAVTGLKRSTRKERPPAPFNTTSFLAAASSLRISAAKAMSIAEDLYTHGYISYPRTDNTVYPPSLDLRSILDRLRETPFKPDAETLLAQEEMRASRGKMSATDHPPIHPTAPATPGKLRPDAWKVYELVVRRFMATVAWDAVQENTVAQLDIGGEPFVADGRRYLDRGWKRFYPYFRDIENLLPALEEGDHVTVRELRLLDLQTKPPARFTQGKLIQEMDRRGLGTKSTRHTIIQKLYDRGYITGTSIAPTGTGRAVSSALEKHARTVTDPEMTATLERDMTLIAEGQSSLDKVVGESREMLTNIMDVLESERKAIGDEIKIALREQNTIGTCPQCGGSIISMRSRRNKRFAGCINFPKCRQSYPLPQRGRIEAAGRQCESCGGPMITLYSSRSKLEFCVNLECPTNAERVRRNAEEKERRQREEAEAAAAKKAEDAKKPRPRPKRARKPAATGGPARKRATARKPRAKKPKAEGPAAEE
jgi:DNA topoisomerase-1